MKKMKRFLFMALMLLMSIAFYGCGSDKKDNAGKSDESVSSEEPTKGGSVVVGITQDLDSLDPHKAVAAGTREVMFNIFEGLFKPDENGDLQPALASDYSVNEEGTIYTFTIREGVKFHNGNTVTADDVVYSIKRVAGLLDKNEKDIRQISALKNISEVNKKDDSTVEVKLAVADTELTSYLTAGDCAVIPADYTDEATKPVGTGPFVFESYSPLDSMVVKKNADYWNTEAMPYLDEVTFKIFSSADAAFLQVQAGSVDILAYLTDEQANQLSNSDCDVKEGNMNLVQGLFLNNKTEPFNNPKVREALNYAIDKQAIIDMVADGKGTIIGSNLTPGLSSYYDESLSGLYQTNVEKAKELLKEAGYENGLKFKISVPSNYQFHVDTAQVIVEQLKQAGITAEINLIDWPTWLSDVYTKRDYQATIVGLDGNLSPRNFMERFKSDADNNFINFNNKEYDSILKEVLSATDDETKVTDYKKLQAVLAEDSASVYLQDPALLVAVNKKLGGYKFYPVYVQDMSSIYYTAQ